MSTIRHYKGDFTKLRVAIVGEKNSLGPGIKGGTLVDADLQFGDHRVFLDLALDRKIAATQRLVEKSVNLVHRFALELRPAVLDDLGLIPALHSFMKTFMARTGIRTSLTTLAEVETLDMNRRTTLFRVVQEALTNVARHARASHAVLSLDWQAAATDLAGNDNAAALQSVQAVDTDPPTAVIVALQHMSAYSEAALVGARVGAAQMGIITQSDDSSNGAGEDDDVGR